MNNRITWTIAVMLFILIIIILTIPIGANEGGFGDGFVNGNDCISCHDTDHNLALSAGHKSITIGSLKSWIRVQANVDMSRVSDPSDTYGIALLTPTYGNLSEDGWTIISDPKGNPVPRNYIERSRTNNTLMEWRVDNSPGSYIIRIVVFYGSGTTESFEEVDVNINIGEPKGNNPPQLTSPKAVLLSDDLTYNFEVTYKDVEGEFPQNISVNISGLGSFEMLPRTQPPFDFHEGVTYYHLTTLSDSRYSYHFAANDGKSWNTTENSFFYTGEDEEATVDSTPLVFGVLFASIVVGTVYIFRGKKT